MTRRPVNVGAFAAVSAAVVCVLGLGGCKAGPGTQTPDAGAASSDGGGDPGVVRAPSGERVVFASRGVPHGSAISLIAASPGGDAALTRDVSGGVRLWPALDGSREPLVVPIRDPRSMALAAYDGGAGEGAGKGAGKGGFTLALLDATGGGRIVGVDPSGAMQPLASFAPTENLAQMIVLPGGERLVAVGSDHVLRLFDREGHELGRADPPGLRPASLRLAADAEGGAKVVAISAGEFNNTEGRFAVEVYAVELGEDHIALAPSGHPQVLLDSPPTVDNPSLSPDGRTLIYLQRQRVGGATWVVNAKQLDDGRELSVDSQLGLGVFPRFGLMDAGRVLLDDGSGLGRVVDLRDRKVELRPLRTAPNVNHQASTFVSGRRLVPSNTWLAVHDLDADAMHYLGYESISVNSAGLSPAAERVAWSLGDRVAVESLAGADQGEVFEVPETRGTNQQFVGFLDDEHLTLIDWAGGLELVRWRDGEVVAGADLGSNANLSELRRHADGGGVMFVRTNLWQNPVIVELSKGGIGARHLAHGASNLAGVLAPAGAPLAQWGGWTLDGAGRLHRFTLERLEAGVDVATALAEGELLSTGVPEQLVLGSDGTRFSIRTTGLHATLTATPAPAADGSATGAAPRDTQLATGFVVSLSPSPDGARLAIVQQRDPGQVLTVYDSASLQPLWAQPLPAAVMVSWSELGEALAVPASFGGVVLDGGDGSPVTARCGLGFERRTSPPPIMGSFDQLSVCDL